MRRVALALAGILALAPCAHAEVPLELRHEFVSALDGMPLAVTECGPADAAAYSGREPWANDVQAVIDAKHLDHPLVVGWSYGGIVAAHYLKVHGSEGVRGLMLVGSSGGLVPPGSMSGGLSADQMARVARAAATPDIPGQIDSAKCFVSVLTASPRPPEEAAQLVDASLMLPAYVRVALRGIQVDNAGLEGILTMPVSFVVDAHDATRSIDGLRAVAARLPKGKVVVYEKSGHSPFLEEPERFNRELAEMATAGR